MADELLREVAPLLRAEGIDIDDPDTYDMETLNAALARAVERRNFDRMVATGPRLSYARTVLRLFTEALGSDQRALAEGIIWGVEPEPTDATKASVAHVIGVSLGLSDAWQSDPGLTGMLTKTVVPRWGSAGRAAANDILALAKKGRAFDSIGALHRRHGGVSIIEGGALVVAGSLIVLSKSQGRELHVTTAELLAPES